MADGYPATLNWALKCEDAAQQVEQQNTQEARVAVNRAFSNPGFFGIKKKQCAMKWIILARAFLFLMNVISHTGCACVELQPGRRSSGSSWITTNNSWHSSWPSSNSVASSGTEWTKHNQAKGWVSIELFTMIYLTAWDAWGPINIINKPSFSETLMGKLPERSWCFISIGMSWGIRDCWSYEIRVGPWTWHLGKHRTRSHHRKPMENLPRHSQNPSFQDFWDTEGGHPFWSNLYWELGGWMRLVEGFSFA